MSSATRPSNGPIFGLCLLSADSQPTTNCDLRLSGFDAYVTSAFSDVFSVGQDLIITELNCVSTFNFLMGIVSIKRNLIIRNNR